MSHHSREELGRLGARIRDKAIEQITTDITESVGAAALLDQESASSNVLRVGDHGDTSVDTNALKKGLYGWYADIPEVFESFAGPNPKVADAAARQRWGGIHSGTLT